MRLLLLSLVVLGCKAHQDGAPVPMTEKVDSSIQPVNEADAKAFAAKLTAATRPSCSEATIGPLIDADALLQKVPAAAQGSASPAVTVEAARAAATRIMCAWLQGISSYYLVGVRTVDGRPKVIMRRLITHPESGGMHVNYDALQLRRGADRELRLVDALAYRQGKWLSELLVSNVAEPALDFVGETTAPTEVHQIRDLIRANKREEAIKLIDALPKGAHDELAVQLLRVNAAAGLTPELYKQALDELAKTFPEDPRIALTELDGALDRDADADALHWIDLLEKELGPDAFLDSMRAIALVRKGDLDQALARADAAVKREPTLTRAHEIRLDVLIARKQWKDVLAQLSELERNHSMTFEEAKLRAEPRLAELIASPEFSTWLKTR